MWRFQVSLVAMAVIFARTTFHSHAPSVSFPGLLSLLVLSIGCARSARNIAASVRQGGPTPPGTVRTPLMATAMHLLSRPAQLWWGESAATTMVLTRRTGGHGFIPTTSGPGWTMGPQPSNYSSYPGGMPFRPPPPLPSPRLPPLPSHIHHRSHRHGRHPHGPPLPPPPTPPPTCCHRFPSPPPPPPSPCPTTSPLPASNTLQTLTLSIRAKSDRARMVWTDSSAIKGERARWRRCRLCP